MGFPLLNTPTPVLVQCVSELSLLEQWFEVALTVSHRDCVAVLTVLWTVNKLYSVYLSSQSCIASSALMAPVCYYSLIVKCTTTSASGHAAMPLVMNVLTGTEFHCYLHSAI